MPAPSNRIQNPPPSRQEDLISLVHSLTQKVDTLSSAWAKDLAKLATLTFHSNLPPKCILPLMISSCKPPNGSNYPFWLQALNLTLCYIFKSNTPVNDSPAFLSSWLQNKD
ncbi:hypothetical protein O181_062549 [Austropuccinia psidii MF-1]|uniref:Uncharacterized protein n=1 Tax=Austropuccinia psidii MF-1 TaxID=1389203 RepID=A0A9Q3I1N5_9BASI|nr:hypothetical protein [Austropuccinia psidii MF-1]